MKICVASPVQPEFSLCGDAYDAYQTGDAEEPIILGEVGQRVTCPNCLRIIKMCKSMRFNKVIDYDNVG